MTSTREAASSSNVGFGVSSELSCFLSDALFLEECLSSLDELLFVRTARDFGLLGDAKSTSS